MEPPLNTMPETRSDSILKSQVKEVLMDDEVLSTIKRTICQALDVKFQILIVRLDKQDGVIMDLQSKMEIIEHDLSTYRSSGRHVRIKM